MSRAEAESPENRSFVSRSFETWTRVATNIPRAAALSMVGPALLIILGYVFWIKFGANVLDQSYFGLKAENITLTPVPAYIKTDINREVYEGSHLQRISLRDREACSSIAEAYTNHPWIERVLRVQKMAGSQVKVDVEFRRPLAFIYRDEIVRTDPNPNSTSGSAQVNGLYYPVDVHGVNLPHKDFTADDILRYFQIFCPDVDAPTGPVGSTYNDPRILKALEVCAALEAARIELGIEGVNVRPESTSQYANWTFELQLKDGRRVEWGHAPGEEVPGEGAPAQKLANLRKQLLTQLVSEPVGESQPTD